METHFRPCPPGDFKAIIDDVSVRRGTSGNGNTWTMLIITWEVLDDEPKQATGLERVLVRQSFFLQLNEDGGLARGVNKNVRLGKVRDAVGQNSGESWSPLMLKGAGPAIVHVVHDANPNDPEDIRAEVTRVVKLA
jgi:hypothetical protein